MKRVVVMMNLERQESVSNWADAGFYTCIRPSIEYLCNQSIDIGAMNEIVRGDVLGRFVSDGFQILLPVLPSALHHMEKIDHLLCSLVR